MPVMNENGMKLLQFGYGDLYVSSVLDDEGKTYGVVICAPEDEVREIGEYWPESAGQPIDNYNPQVIMQFDAIESIDVVIDILQKTKEIMSAESEKSNDLRPEAIETTE